jgi:hypothetical protein
MRDTNELVDKDKEIRKQQFIVKLYCHPPVIDGQGALIGDTL